MANPTTPEMEKLLAKEAAIKKRIREIQARGKSGERKERTARLIRWGIVVEGLLKNSEMGQAEWVDACKRILNVRDFEIATAKIQPGASLAPAHLGVSRTSSEKPCAPAAGESA